jgi:hypothetical protein
MIKRIEFTLNLDDPQEAELFRALTPSLRYRRAGAVIRHALQQYFEPAEGQVDDGIIQVLKEQSHGEA